MRVSYSLTTQPVHHSVIPLDTTLYFRPISSDETEPMSHMPDKLLKAARQPSGPTREVELMTMMYANITVMHMLKKKVLPQMGAAHLTPLNDIMAQHGVPLSYNSKLVATDVARYRGSYMKYLRSPTSYHWKEPRIIDEPTELVTFTVPAVYADERVSWPSAFETHVTTTTAWAELVEQELVNLTFERMFA